ncbi:MAG TPA: amino acid adenylation domain-containing protein, partial [Thermoanaerobaculia bacterium]|nr:amino acid adenylation domain-containing protein [Thermoanaerobaculia bacterium]
LTEIGHAAAGELPRRPFAHEVIAARAAERPAAVAVSHGGEVVTYGELDRRAEGIAHRLRAWGIGCEDRVGIFGERGVGMLATILGTLKAGTVFVPLDPRHPDPRLRAVLETAELRLIATQNELAARARELGPSVLCWDEPDTSDAADAAAVVEIDPRQLACVFYTSGSTGIPKGAMVEHAGMLNHLWAKIDLLGLDAASVVVQNASHCFDISVWQFLAALMTGGRVMIYGEETAIDPAGLLRAIRRDRVTVLETVPTLLEPMLQAAEEFAAAGESVDLPDLTRLISNAETLPVPLCRRWFERYPSVPLLNTYGATECSDDTTHQVMHTPPPPDTLRVGVGRPIPGFRIHVLDPHLDLAPFGCPGQIGMAGVGVGRGYLGDPVKTAATFVPDPFAEEPGDRLYLTGDLGRWTPDGELDFLGRRDHQVKIRGHRVELGEVEAVLARYHGLREVVVLALEAPAGGQQLVAYLVPGAAGLDVAAVRAFLRERLPEPMVPTAFVELAALPLTANGKVDRRALPAPEPQEREAGEHPRTAVQVLLATVWAEVLGRERVGLADDFFALGGHSLLATQVTSRVRAVFGVELPVRAVFERPTVVEMAELVAAALGSGSSPHTPPLVPVPRDRPLSLSFAQQRLWFLDQLEPGSPLYNIPAAVRLDGPLDPRLFGRVLGEIVRRHEVLRTTFLTVDGRPVQAISPPQPFPLPIVNLTGLGGAERQTQAARLAAAESVRPFDLERGPVLRAALLRLQERQHVLLVTLHHIAGDGWSVDLFLRELALLYHAFAEGRPSPLPELAIQYADFAVWQRSWLAGEVLESQIAYWRERLAGAPAVLDLTTDRPRPAVPGHRGERWPVEPPAALAEELRRLGRREGATLFMVVLAAFQTLLARHSGQGDVVIGTPIAGRDRLETEELIGFFVNTLALRIDSAGDPSFRELLARVREVTLGAYTHQELPFERLVETLQPERHLNRSPLFQVMFAFQNVPQGGPGIPGLAISALPVDLEVAKFDLVLTLGESAAGLTGTLEYDADLFDRSTAARLASHLNRFLDEIAADPARRVSEVPQLAPAEQHQLLVEWNDSAADYAGAVCLHELIESQVERSPDAVALSCGGEELSYAELERRSNLLAHRLRELGAGPEVPVAMCVERSLAMLVGLLAVLKAGGAYVPLDPDYPSERLASMIEDSGASLLLAQSHLVPRLPAGNARVLLLDHEDGAAAPGTGRPPARPIGGAMPDSLVYVLFTSGSTGRPKGAAISHRAILNRLLWMQEALRLSAKDRVLQKTPFGFDVSVWELFWPFVTGACLVVARPGGHRDNAYLAHLIAEEEITVLHFVPSMLQLFLEESSDRGGAGGCGTLRDVVCSGEALPSELVRRFAARLGHARLHNLYGPTEAAVDVTSWVCDEAGNDHGGIPIGRPIANTRIHLLDRNLLPVPLGVAGELFIAGVNLARGYIGRPDLTADRFLPDPEAKDPGERVYRTGDLARWRGDGAIEYLGRLDHQVKIRGVRIELGEIEAALTELPGVREAVVMARSEKGDGDKRLVAYVVGDVPAGELRQALWERLPEAMVPSAFVKLAALPLNANGKVDRKALSAGAVPEQPGAGEEGYVAPRTREEEILAGVWTQILRLPRVGVNDNFFELGGDSILSVQIVARARQAGLLFTTRQVFEHQTVAGLARHAEVADAAAVSRAEQGPVTGEVPLAPMQQWFLGDDPVDAHHFNQSLLLQSGQALDPVALEQVIGYLLAHHDALRLRFVREREGWRQRNDPPGRVPFHRVDLTGLPAARRAPSLEAAAAQAQACLNLSDGPLLRAVFFTFGGEKGERLLLAVHHLGMDGVSWRILLTDLETGYTQITRGQALRLPQKTTSFKGWAERLAGYARSQDLRSELGYWLAGPRMQAARLPLDGSGDEDGWSPATLSISLSTEETRCLVQEVPAASRAHVQELLLAALALALRRWTGKDALLIDMEGHGREEVFGDVDLTRTVGWFTTLFPLLVDLQGEREPGAVLARVQGQVRAVPGRGFGYGVLRYLSPDPEVAERLAVLPPAQIVFNYLGRFDGVAETSSLFHLAPESTGPTSSPRLKRKHLLEVGAWVGGGRLVVTFTYLETAHRVATIEALTGDFLASLRTLIALCLAGGPPEVLPPDLALGIDPKELEEALHEIEFEGWETNEQA